MDNSDQLVVITGGTKGIGRALVRRFAKEGCPVATCARHEADLVSLKKNVEDEFGTRVYTYVANLSKPEKVVDFVEFIRLTNKKVAVLVNNAGVFMPGEVLTEKDGMLEAMINTNLYSAYRLTRGLAPEMRKSKSGHIFNICSVASLLAYPNGGSYSISKFAMYGFSKALREELKGDGVRVTSVLAGAVKTPSWDGVDLPEERLMPAEDIAETICSTWKLSDRTVIEDLLLRPQLGDI